MYKLNKWQWRRKWQPTLVFLPGESHGQRSLVGCSLWGRTESDTTEVTCQQQQDLKAESPSPPTHMSTASVNSFSLIYSFIYFWLCWDFIAACRISLTAVVSRAYSSWWGWGFLIVVTFLVGLVAQVLGTQASVVVACGPSRSTAYGILVPWPGIEPVSSAVAGGFLTIGPPGKSLFNSF